MSTYCVGDLHGCYNEFMEFVDKIRKKDKDAHFILVGDIVDRGPDTIKLLRWAIENVNKEDSPFEMIIGNHEYMKIEELEYYFERLDNGNGRKIISFNMSYDFNLILAQEKIDNDEIRSYLEFFKALPYYKEIDVKSGNDNRHFIIVHAAVNSLCINDDGTFNKESLSLEANKKHFYKYGHTLGSNIVWDRNYNGYGTMVGNSIIIHGHTPTVTNDMIDVGAIPGRIDYRPHDINIDCGLVFHSYPEAEELHPNLAAICLETLEEIYLYEPTPYPEDYNGEALMHRDNILNSFC